MIDLDNIKRLKPQCLGDGMGPDRCPRLDGKFGGMRHHGAGEPTTREMPPWHPQPQAVDAAE